jgi:general secretion pathway protein J
MTTLTHRSRGFTLIELLVAITVLSIVSLIAWRGLDSLVATRERLEPEVDEVRALLTAFGQMERDIWQVPNPAFLGLATSPLNVRMADGVEMLELARVAPAVPDRATEVQTVYYRVVDGTLMRQSTPPLPGFERTDPERLETARLLTSVQAMRIRIWQQGIGWVPAFDQPGTEANPPAAGGRSQTPAGIEVTLERSDGKQFRRVFLVGA